MEEAWRNFIGGVCSPKSFLTRAALSPLSSAFWLFIMAVDSASLHNPDEVGEMESGETSISMRSTKSTSDSTHKD